MVPSTLAVLEQNFYSANHLQILCLHV